MATTYNKEHDVVTFLLQPYEIGIYSLDYSNETRIITVKKSDYNSFSSSINISLNQLRFVTVDGVIENRYINIRDARRCLLEKACKGRVVDEIEHQWKIDNGYYEEEDGDGLIKLNYN